MKRFIGVYNYTVILTYFSLVSAVIGFVLASEGNCGGAVLCVMLSGICDAFDGAVARTKKDRTEDEKDFGIQLDSLCDLVSFGVLPAFICYRLGADGALGLSLVVFYSLAALIRLAFFNVLEAKRQREEKGKRKYYRGLPVTTICVILPLVYIVGSFVPSEVFVTMLYLTLALTGFLFVLDFKVKKPETDKILHIFMGKREENSSEEEENAQKH